MLSVKYIFKYSANLSGFIAYDLELNLAKQIVISLVSYKKETDYAILDLCNSILRMNWVCFLRITDKSGLLSIIVGEFNKTLKNGPVASFDATRLKY